MIVSTKQKQVGAREDAPAHRRLNKRPVLRFCAPGAKAKLPRSSGSMRIASPASLLRPAKSSKNKHAHKLVLEGELAVVIERRWEARGYVLSIETFWPVTSEKYNEGPETRRPAANVRRETSGANLLPINPTAWCASVDCRGLS